MNNQSIFNSTVSCLVLSLIIVAILFVIIFESGKSKALNNLMFGNVGKKIKGIAKLFTWLVMFASLFISVFVFIMGINYSGSYELSRLLIISPLILIGGCLSAWLSFICLYGFGELIDKISEDKNNT